MNSGFRQNVLLSVSAYRKLMKTNLNEIICLNEDYICSLNTTCVQQYFNENSFVCVCNATYCDEIEPVVRPPPGQYLLYTSSKDGDRLKKSSKKFVKCDSTYKLETDGVTLKVDHGRVKQTIKGFGGSFTDSTGQNILSLSKATQKKLIDAYFSEAGIEYSVCRVPIGGCDYSPRIYSYDDDVKKEDFLLKNFSLAPEDIKYKIPFIKQAKLASRRPIKLFGSPWSSPGWMKTSGKIEKQGELRGEIGGQFYQVWANYFVRFLDEYKSNGLKFWAVTTQNEPLFACTAFPNKKFNRLCFDAQSQKIFVERNLGPTLKLAGHGQVDIMIADDQSSLLPWWPQVVLGNRSAANEYVQGIAFHWYFNDQVGPQVLDDTHDLFPDKYLISTEACEGVFEHDRVRLGSWERGEHYAMDILTDLQHWTVGWVDWNMALDMSGGFIWLAANGEAGNDSPVIVNAKKDEFYKQPMFYALGHFSKFVSPGSVVVGLTANNASVPLASIAFDNPEDRTTIIVIVNRSNKAVKLTITDNDYENFSINEVVPARSFQTYVYPHKQKTETCDKN